MSRAQLEPEVRTASTVRRAAWIAVGLLWFVALLNYLDRLVLTTMREAVVASIPMTEAQFGMLTSIFLWVYGALSPVCGFLGDRFSRKQVIFFSLLVWSALTWATGHARTYEQLFWARALMGISEACYLPAALALITDHHRGPTRSFATGLHSTGIYVGGALGGIGGYLAETVGWRAGFTVLGAIGVGYALFLILFLRDATDWGARRAAGEEKGTIAAVGVGNAVRALFTVRAFWVLALINALAGIADWTIYGWLPTYLREHFGLSVGRAGLTATGVLQVTSFVGVLAGGLWSDRWSRRNARARTLVPFTGYLAAAPGLLLLALSGALLPALAGLTLYGLARGFFDANRMPIIRQLVDERYSATAYGCMNLVSCFTGGVMTYLGGGLRDAHLSLSIAFDICAGAIAVTALCCAALKPASSVSRET